MANEVFISYSRRDYQKVRKIKDTIDRKVGIDCWMDLDGIESDQQFVDVIINAINKYDTVLFMMSEASMQSKWALDELAFAEKKHKRIVLVRLDKAEMPDNFYFLYHGKDQIEWGNREQQTKLMNNIRSWFPKTPIKEEKLSPIGGEGEEKGVQKLTKSFYFKALSVSFVVLLLCCIGFGAYHFKDFVKPKYKHESKEPDSTQKDHPRKCPICDGTGMIIGMDSETGKNTHHVCYACNGTGIVP